MTNARFQLMRLLQTLFETKLRGIFRWDGVDFYVAEEVDKVPGKSRQPFGKFKEIVSIRFGAYDLTVESSNHRPPLGRMVLTGPGGTVEENSLDTVALDRIGEHIIMRS